MNGTSTRGAIVVAPAIRPTGRTLCQLAAAHDGEPALAWLVSLYDKLGMEL